MINLPIRCLRKSLGRFEICSEHYRIRTGKLEAVGATALIKVRKMRLPVDVGISDVVRQQFNVFSLAPGDRFQVHNEFAR